MKKYTTRVLSIILFFTLASSSLASSIPSIHFRSLLPDEQNTVHVFQKSSPKVVYVHRLTNLGSRHSAPRQIPDGAGSGIIWDRQGHIVTNYHVIKGADDLAITLGNMTVPAKIIGIEPRKDLAVLQVKSPQVLAYLKTYTPFDRVHLQDLIVGQTALAIGNPFGLDHSLSKGIISALGREVPGIGGVTIRNMIQTDTAINPGNSGGPLLNSAGQLIGLNTMIYSQSGASAGIGFAVPADDVHRTVTQIIQHGRVILSGIGIQQVEPNLAKNLGVTKGILIARTLPHTPAALSKLRSTYKDARGRLVMGDIILAINAHPIANYDALYNFLTEVKVGEQITLSIQRGNKHMDVQIKTIDIAAL